MFGARGDGEDDCGGVRGRVMSSMAREAPPPGGSDGDESSATERKMAISTPKRTLMASYAATTFAANVVRTPGVEENDGGGRVRRRSQVVATPESAGGGFLAARRLATPTPIDADERDDRVGAGKRAAPSGGFDSPERENIMREDVAYDASERTPPSSPTRKVNVCPQTPIKVRRTRVACFDDGGDGDDMNASGRTRRSRVVRSLLEEFEAAERSLEDMVERSDATTISRNLRDDPFDDPF